MPNTDTRSVRESYWYTSAQIVDVGDAWQKENRERLFLYSTKEPSGSTALKKNNLPQINNLPKKILLPLNLGGDHWTAIAVNVSNEEGKIKVNLWYTDSMNTNLDLAEHAYLVQKEITRIESIFREKYDSNQLAINSAVYSYTWRQADASSCGPYSLANGFRCLDGRGQEDNPGRRKIREQQLNMMTQATSIKGCSTSNAVDEILLDWIIDQAKINFPLSVTKPEEVAAICDYYAKKKHKEVKDIEKIFHDEYCSGTVSPFFRPYVVNARIREIIGEQRIQLNQSFLDPFKRYFNANNSAKTVKAKEQEPVQKVAAKIAQENISQKIDNLRSILSKGIQNEIFLFEVMHELTLFMHRGHQDDAEKKLIEVLLGENLNIALLDESLRAVSDIIGMRAFSQANDEKFTCLASAYKSLADAVNLVQEVSFKETKNTLEAYVSLLQGAIDRNNAPLLRQVWFAIKDFVSTLVEFISCGVWQSELKRIEVIRKQFEDSTGAVNLQQLQQGRDAIKTIIDAKTSIEKELEEHVTAPSSVSI